MDNIIDAIKSACAAVGALIGVFIGGADGLIFTLLAFMIIDYLTGVMCAVSDHKLNSAVGFKGLCRKVIILALVGVGNLIDTHVIKSGAVIRTAVIFFYLANEGISIIENAAKLGLPIPRKLRMILEQLQERSEGDDNNTIHGDRPNE